MQVMEPTRRNCPTIYSRSPAPSAAKETEPELSERWRRGRGKPRREPSTDHERGSLHSSRDDDVPQPTVGEEAVPQIYDGVFFYVMNL